MHHLTFPAIDHCHCHWVWSEIWSWLMWWGRWAMFGKDKILSINCIDKNRAWNMFFCFHGKYWWTFIFWSMPWVLVKDGIGWKFSVIDHYVFGLVFKSYVDCSSTLLYSWKLNILSYSDHKKQKRPYMLYFPKKRRLSNMIH